MAYIPGLKRRDPLRKRVIYFLRTKWGYITLLIFLVIALSMIFLIAMGVFSLSISDDNKRVIDAISTIITTSFVIVAAILSYFKFFKGRTFSPKLLITLNSGFLRLGEEKLYWIEVQLENKGSVAIWDYIVHIYADIHNEKFVPVKIVDFAPLPSEITGREKIIEVGETVFEHAFYFAPQASKFVTFRTVVKDRSDTLWTRCITVSEANQQSGASQ